MTTSEDLKHDQFVLSGSGFASWLRCPRAYGYSRVARLKIPPPWAVIGGSAMDATMNEHHDQRIKGVNGLRGSAFTDFYATTFRRLVDELAPSGEPDTEALDDGTRLIPIYEKRADPVIEPVEIQKEVTLDVGGYPTIGHIDLIYKASDDHLIVADHKFVSRMPEADRAQNSLQLRTYARATGIDHVALISLVRRKREPDVIFQHHFVTEADQAELQRHAQTIGRMCKAGIFPMTDPMSWACKPTQCGYWKICRGRDGGPLPIPGETA